MTLHRFLAMLATVAVLTACGTDSETKTDTATDSPKTEKKVYGKITKVDVGPTIDESMVKSGHEVFETKCSACHKMDERYVGPALGTVATRRTPEFVMNMILDTETMIQNDDTVKCLLQEYLVQMPNQSVDEKDARNVLEYLRKEGAERQ